MASMFGQCLSLVQNCLYGDGADWAMAAPHIPASQPIPEVILDTSTMGSSSSCSCVGSSLHTHHTRSRGCRG